MIGYVDEDNVGIAGMEKYLDQQSLTDPHVPGFAVDPDRLKPVRLSLDLKATHALRDELVNGMERYHAKAAAGMIADVNTGEVIALEIPPDFDPNDPGDMRDPTKINRINVGVYEMGSTFKALSLAMALESARSRSAPMWTRARACATGGSRSMTSTPPIASSRCPKCSLIPRTSARPGSR